MFESLDAEPVAGASPAVVGSGAGSIAGGRAAGSWSTVGNSSTAGGSPAGGGSASDSLVGDGPVGDHPVGDHPVGDGPAGDGLPVDDVLAGDWSSVAWCAWLAGEQPGAQSLAWLCALDPEALSDSERVDLLVAFERQAAFVAAGQLRVLAAMGTPPAGVPCRPDALDATGAPSGTADGAGAWDRVGGPAADGADGVDPCVPVEVPEVFDDGDDWVREEVAAALHVAPITAYNRLRVARGLYYRLPSTLAVLAGGELTAYKAMLIAEATEPLPLAAAGAVEARVLPKAPDYTTGELRRALKRAVHAVDPIRAEDAHAAAVQQRTVQHWPLPDGMAKLRAILPAEDALAVWTALDALAHAHQPHPVPDGPNPHPDPRGLHPRGAGARGADPRGIDARRADALTALAYAVLGPDHPAQPGQPGHPGHPALPGLPGLVELPTWHGRRPHIQVTVAATTLLGLDEHPAELAGYGPISADAARRLAAAGTWRRLLTDPATGALLDYGRTTYRPPTDLADYLIARDQVCGFPGCSAPARRCDLDHCTCYREGGTTCRFNMGPLCRRHHRLKHETGWHLQRHPDQSWTWTSPTGRTYHMHPPSQAP